MLRGFCRVVLLWGGLLLLSAPAILHGCNSNPDDDTEPADTDPADTEPADTEPADTEPADTDPADTCFDEVHDDFAFSDGHPDLDITAVRAEISDANVTLIDIDVAGTFPADTSLYSWFVEISFLDADGLQQVQCYHQMHDGVPSDACTAGNAASFTTCERPDGLTVIYDGSAGPPLTSFSVSSGVQASSSDPGPVMHDPVTGQFPDPCVDLQTGCD